MSLIALKPSSVRNSTTGKQKLLKFNERLRWTYTGNILINNGKISLRLSGSSFPQFATVHVKPWISLFGHFDVNELGSHTMKTFNVNHIMKQLREGGFIKKVFLKNLQTSEKYNCSGVSFLIKKRYTGGIQISEKETPAQMFSRIFKNTYFEKKPANGCAWQNPAEK